MSKESGGPAFPLYVYAEDNGPAVMMGLTMRDYFAAMAMQAIIAKSPFLASPDDFTPYEKTAIGAYDYAEAMLKTRGE